MPPFILVGNKKDVRASGSDQVSPQQAEQMKQSIGAAAYAECSALEADGVEEVFEKAVRAVVALNSSGSGGGGGCCVVS